MCREAIKLTVTGTSFPKFSFLLESQNFIIGNKIQSVVVLDITRLALCMFRKTSPSNPHLFVNHRFK